MGKLCAQSSAGGGCGILHWVENADFIVIGAGVAGASVAYWLARHARVTVLEREPQPGYHSTGRSAALFMETYGPEQVRALTRASRRFFENPPRDLSSIRCSPPGHPGHRHKGAGTATRRVLGRDQLVGHPHATTESATDLYVVPVVRAGEVLGSVYEPHACDIDVHALHQGYLRELRRRGGVLHCDSEVTRIEREAAIGACMPGTKCSQPRSFSTRGRLG